MAEYRLSEEELLEIENYKENHMNAIETKGEDIEIEEEEE